MRIAKLTLHIIKIHSFMYGSMLNWRTYFSSTLFALYIITHIYSSVSLKIVQLPSSRCQRSHVCVVACFGEERVHKYQFPPIFLYTFTMAHTILLVQPGPKPETRTFSDYESVNECMEAGVCKIYEEHLKRMNPNTPSITYDISQLFDFIDQLADLSCLVYQKSTNTYAPYNKDWIKEKIYILLRRQAAK